MEHEVAISSHLIRKERKDRKNTIPTEETAVVRSYISALVPMNLSAKNVWFLGFEERE